MTLTFERALPGRLVSKTCKPDSAKLRRHKSCTRYVPAGSYRFSDRAGPCSVRFEGILANRRKLAPGRYRVTVTATNAAGRRSTPAATTFTLLAAPKKR